MKLKRIISLIIALFTFIAAYPAVVLAEDDHFEKLIDLNFNDCSFSVSSDFGFSSITDGASAFPVSVDPEHGTSLASVFSSESILTYELPYSIKNGMYHFGFEIQRANNFGAYTYIRMCNEKCKDGDDTANMSETFAMNSSGQIGATENNAGWNLITVPYEINKWYKVDMWLDFEAKTITYYINNEYLTLQPMKPAVTDIKKIDFYLPKIVYLDNMVLERVSYKAACEMVESGITVPEKILNPIAFTFDSGRSGNIFYNGEEINFNYSAENLTDGDMSCDVKYSLINYRGKVLKTWEDSVIALL